MTANYAYNRSMHNQIENDYSPYADKQYNSHITMLFPVYIKIKVFHSSSSI